MEEDLNNEEKALNESFKMHFDTLQKLVVSISDRIAWTQSNTSTLLFFFVSNLLFIWI